MIRFRRSLAPALLMLAACGGGSEVSEPSLSSPAAPAPTTVETTFPPTTVERSTTTTSEKTPADPVLEQLTQALPTISGYSYGDVLPISFWDLGEGSEGMSRPVLVDGAWVGEVSVASAGSSTAEAWSAFVNDHHSELAVLGGEPVESGEALAVVSNLGVPAWEQIDDELVLHALVDPDWAGVWYHDGLVWGVSGPETQARVYAERLIEQQAVTGSEPEPEQTDIDVLEGPLAELAVEVPGFMYVDVPHQQVLDTLRQLGACQDHVSAHAIHPADDPDPVYTYDEADITVLTSLWSDLPGCDSGQWFVTDLIENSGFVPVEGGAAASPDGTAIVWVAETGAMVQAIGADAAALETYRPVLEAIAEASSALAR
jgi:hypothetical protein